MENESKLDRTYSEIAEDLLLGECGELFGGFDLDNHAAVDNHVEALPSDVPPFEHDLDDDLARHVGGRGRSAQIPERSCRSTPIVHNRNSCRLRKTPRRSNSTDRVREGLFACADDTHIRRSRPQPFPSHPITKEFASISVDSPHSRSNMFQAVQGAPPLPRQSSPYRLDEPLSIFSPE